MAATSLSAQHLTKRYEGVVALSDGNLDVQYGEVVALLGSNGSGKSTLSKVVTGAVAPDGGRLLLDGQEVRFSSPKAARKAGIAAVYQELSLVPDMSVAENIWLTNEPLKWGRVRTREVKTRTEQLLEFFAGTVRSSLRPETPVSALPPDERQIVEILKALGSEPRIMILDEATASLDSNQVRRLFELINEWKTRDMAMVFVSHRMEEIFRIADRATVLRGGRTVGTMRVEEADEQDLVALMIEGGVIAQQTDRPSQEEAGGDVLLNVEDVHAQMLRGVTLQLRKGEILGLGGLQGQGQTDLLLALFGAISFSGRLRLSGREMRFTHPREAMKEGIAFVPGDRGAEGLLPVRSIFENLQLPSWRRYGRLLQVSRARRDSNMTARRLNLVMGSLNSPVSTLSGGNAQKVVLGKWLLREPKILLLNDPTKGVDVGAKGEFYRIIFELREAGVTVLIYSSDDEELLSLCDRVLVMLDGQVGAELAGSTLTKEMLVTESMGRAHAGA